MCRKLPRGFSLSRPEDVPRIYRKEPQIRVPPPEVVVPYIPLQQVPIQEEPQMKIQVTKPPPIADLFPFSQSQLLLPAVSLSEYLDNRPTIDLATSQTYSVRQENTQPQSHPVPLLPTHSSITVSSQASASSQLQRENSSVLSELWRSNSTISQKSGQVYNIDSTRHKSAERLRIIVQRFKKHRKFPQLTNALSKMGQVAALSRIEEEIKRNCHTLDTFRDKVVELLGTMKEQPPLAQLADEFLMFLNQLVLIGRQEQFQGNLQDIQKSVDRITRDLTEIKQQGQWYAKKKKRNDRPIDPKEIIYICDLIRELPKAYLVGVWEIVNQRPFRENRDYRVTEIDFSQIKSRKIRQVEFYVKRKLQNIRKSRQQKKEKTNRKKGITAPLQGSKVDDVEKLPQEGLNEEPMDFFHRSVDMEVQDPLKGLNEVDNLQAALSLPVIQANPTTNHEQLDLPKQPEEDNIEPVQQPIRTEQPAFVAMEAEDLIAQRDEYKNDDSSDSSMVTDEEDSAD